jgi:hypothetical protein
MSYEIQFYDKKGKRCGSTATLDFGEPKLYLGRLDEIAKEDKKMFPQAVSYQIAPRSSK